MKDLLKRQYKKVITTIVYIVFAILVYTVWLESTLHMWYLDLIVDVAIVIAGLLIGYFWIKAEDKKENEKPIEQIEEEASKPVEKAE